MVLLYRHFPVDESNSFGKIYDNLLVLLYLLHSVAIG